MIYEHGAKHTGTEYVNVLAFQDAPAFIGLEGFSETANVDAHIRLTVSRPDPDNHVAVVLSLAECRELAKKLERLFLMTAMSGDRSALQAISAFVHDIGEKE